MRRLKTHLKDRHRGTWDRFSVYLTVQDDHIKELESLLLRIVSPPGNKQTGRFVASQNLRSQLIRKMREADADRRAEFLGGRLATTRRRKRASSAIGDKALVNAFDRSVRLWGVYQGKDYLATLRRDGTILYKGRVYSSPSGAARAAAGPRRRGWSFWHYRDRRRGEWVPLRSLRR